MFKLILIVGAGSFAGGVSRFLASRFIQNTIFSAFPFATFFVNILGCFLIGLFFGISDRNSFLSNELRMFLTVGFCGGFTTFSAFANENVTLMRDGNFLYAALYVSLSVFLGILATYAGGAILK